MSGIVLRGVRVTDLHNNPANVRENLDGIDELAASIKANGILQPLIVNDQNGRLVVTDGHRRLAAARRAGLPAVPCLVTHGASERRVLTTMVASAMHRQLTPIEQGRAFKRLREQGMTTLEIARATGYSLGAVSNRLLLLELPDEAQEMVEDKTLTVTAATTLAKQVKAKKRGSVGAKSTRSAWFTPSHPLAASIACEHGDRRTLIGGACGQCWEAAIRADERGELQVTPVYDEALVLRVLSGERLPMQRADRLEALRRLHAEGLSDSQIASRLGCTPRQALRDRQALNLPAALEAGSGLPVRSAS